MASVGVTVLDVPTEVSEAAVERRVLAFLERLRTGGRDRRLERLRTDGRAAVGMFRDWAGLDLRTISRMMEEGGAEGLEDIDSDLVWILEDDDVFARMEDHIGSRPLLTARDRTRITRRAKAYAERCNAIVNDALADLGRNRDETERVRKRLLRLAPLLLDGPPGIGKTTWAHRMADILGVPSLKLDASKGLASFALTGTECGWGTAAEDDA